MRQLILMAVSAMLLLACETPENCEVTYGERVPEDTLFYGRWEYKFTITRQMFSQFGPIDTIYLGETRNWMPNGHPYSEITITSSYYEVVNVPASNQSGISNGESCVYECESHKSFNAVAEDTIIFMSLLNLTHANSIAFDAGFYIDMNLSHQNYIYLLQNPSNYFAIFDSYPPNTGTYDYYERVE